MRINMAELCRTHICISFYLFGFHMRLSIYNLSLAVAEMGDRGHNRHVPKRRGGVLCPFHGALGTRLIQCGLDVYHTSTHISL